MSLHISRSSSNKVLWETCAARFLDEIGGHVGPGGFPAVLWVAHRAQRDALLQEAQRRGLAGWLGPPIRFLSELPQLFDVSGKPIGPLARRLLLTRVSAEAAVQHGFPPGDTSSSGPSTMLDALFSEILPEGIAPSELETALKHVEPDDFSKRRNRWIAASLSAYLAALEAEGRYDPRAIHALVARRIEDGHLTTAIGGAATLHIYGIHSSRSRYRLFRALAEQTEVTVHLYLPPPAEDHDEWRGLTATTKVLAANGEGESVAVKPAPDATRELGWVASEVKRLLIDDRVPPHRIAVVARSGREDTGRAYRSLRAAGVPATARIRTPLTEIPAFKALLELYRGAASGWPYRPLRHVLASPYFDIRMDPAGLDFIAEKRRVAGLDSWIRELQRLRQQFEADAGWELRRAGLWPERLSRDVSALRRFAGTVAPLSEPRSEKAWIRTTLDLLRGDSLRFRRRLCRPVGDRWDVVRLDQRGVLQLEILLAEWGAYGASARSLEPHEFHSRLRQLLAGNELALSTPAQKGVQVLEAHEAAMTPYSRTFLIHANDGEFPRTPPGGGVFSNEERVRLREAGLPIDDGDEALRRERDLWRAVTNGATVTVTYRTMDSRGTPRLPSLMVPSHDVDSELPRSLELDADAVSAAQERFLAAAELASLRRSGSADPLAVSDVGRLRHAVLVAYAEARRGTALANGAEAAALGPSPWNGQIRDPQVLRALGKRLGPDYRWSASQLELYARCPFFFFIERVMRLREVAEAEEETGVFTYGIVAHSVLERFYRALGDDVPPSFDARAAHTLETVSEEVFRGIEESDDWLGLPALWEVTRQDVADSVAKYLRWELEQMSDAGERPSRLELSFGFPREGGEVEIAGSDLTGQIRRMKVLGRIDRVDLAGEPGRERYSVVDYKRNWLPGPRGYRDGVLVQMPLYMKVLRDHFGLPIESGGVRSVKQARANRRMYWGDDNFERALRVAFSIPKRARSGLFEAIHASSDSWKDWHPGRDICRTRARLVSGSRFDE